MTVDLVQPVTGFGRAEDNDFVLLADEVSRYHAKIRLVEDRTVLDDLKSMNGTYVNRQRIVERVLSDKDEVYFGSKCRAVFQDDTEEEKQLRKQAAAAAPLSNDLQQIRDEMESVTNNMTMVGQPAVGGAAPTVETRAVFGGDHGETDRMRRAFRRLNALYRASQIMSDDFDVDKRISDVLDLAMEVTGADRGFLMMPEDGSDEIKVRLARGMGDELVGDPPSMSIARRAAIDGESVLMEDSASDAQFSGTASIIMQKINSAMCVPLRADERILGSLYVDARGSGVNFSNEDLELFAAMASQSAMAIENVRLAEQMVEAEKKRASFNRFLSPAVVDKIMSDERDVELGGEKRVVATMYCDIRGFTPLSEGLTPDELVDLLNSHFTALTEIVFKYQGTLDKYIGDEIMALFGAPFSMGNDLENAVRAGVAMQLKMTEMNLEREAKGQPRVEVGIGINSGEVFSGYIGSPDRLDYTVIGDKVNVAARFCSTAKAGQVIIGQSTYDEVKDIVIADSIGEVALKGKSMKMQAYNVTGVKG